MSNKRRLFLLSFLMLFVELALIRWLGSNIVFLSYFSNFVLLGSFLGIGIGFIRAKALPDLFSWASVELAFLVAFVLAFPVVINRSGSQLVYFGFGSSGPPIWLVLPIVFVATATVMASIAQGAARAFGQLEALEAYRIDIIGSLAGVVAFSLLSFLSAPPVVWGAITTALLLFLCAWPPRLVHVVAALSVLVLLGKESLDPQVIWSPYYKISLFATRSGAISLNVNGVPHQWIESMVLRKQNEPLYFAPYTHLRSNPLRDVLIIGAGSGGDVAIALAAGAKHVDAVEIDPRIYQLGRRLNPDRPYQKSRVTMHINDGRAFLQRTTRRYDLILLALPDSLALVSGQSSLRLESYLFTLEAMRAARAHLNPGGAFGMYNYYRERWLVDRFAYTLETAFGQRPCIDAIGRVGWFALLMVGRERGNVTCSTRWAAESQPVPTAVSDDYPFPYLQSRSIPRLYLITLAAILVLSIILIRATAGPLTPMRSYIDLFFMGTAFLLLETKNVVQFALLFGTTWFVNALVFVGILIAVLAAVEAARRLRFRSPFLVYALLFASLALAWAVEPEGLLSLSSPTRFAAAASLAFGPIFLANLVFAQRFRAVGSSTIAFGTNLLGAMVGGVLEYSSMIVGYRDLMILVAIFYGLAFVAGRKHLLLGVPEREQPVLQRGSAAVT
jgi:Spermine/spermidine synthase domain